MASNLISWCNNENEIVADYHKKCQTIYKGKKCTDTDIEEFKKWLEDNHYDIVTIV